MRFAEKPRKVPVVIADDMATGRGSWIDVSKGVDQYEISPDGSRALFEARGEIFTVPARYGSHETVVIPIADERPLYYYGWVQGNLEKVSKATDGKLGYIHIPDMGDAWSERIC